MARRLTIASLLLILAFTASADTLDLIPWSAGSPLSWDLFRGIPPPNAARLSEAAAIDMRIEWHVRYVLRPSEAGSGWVGTVEGVTVTNTMDPTLSWVLLSRASDRILRHEQAHFDLNEVYRRRLETELAGLSARSDTVERARAALEEKIHSVAEEILDRLSAMQERYDDETKHGTDAEAQEGWEEMIATWLDGEATPP